MKARLGKAFAALLMWFFFSLGALAVIVCQFFGIFTWLVTSKKEVFDWVKKTGKGTDALNNGAWFGGNVKETISSHTGRFLLREKEQNIPAPAWAKLLGWILNQFDDNHAIDAIEAPFKDLPL